MSLKSTSIVLALTTLIAAPVPAWAFGGAPGCANLPEYDRAVGALEGLSTCDMSVEQARRIVAATQGGGAPVTAVRHRRQRLAPLEQD